MVQERNASAYRTPRRAPSPAPRNSYWDLQARRYTGAANQEYGYKAGQAATQAGNFDVGANLFQTIPPTSLSGGGGGGGRSGGGGGGGGSGITPEQTAAYKSLYDQMKSDTSVDDAWNSYIESMRGTFDPAKAAVKWDTAGGAVGAAGTQGRERLAGIYDQLLARAATGRQAVAGAVSQGDQALQNIRSRFQGASAQGAGNINNVLSNFDAGQMDPGVYQNELDSLFAAGQIGNQRMGNAYDVAFADRPQVYAGLNSDVASGMTAQEQAMMQQIAAKKAAEAQGLDAQLQQALGTAGISRAQAQQARSAELLKLQADLAEMGIVL